MRLAPNYKRNFRQKIKIEINVTPFIDVMLVLLIIFMITTPIARNGFDIELPEFKGEEKHNNVSINITINSDGKIFIEQEVVQHNKLIVKIKALLTESPELQVMLYADKKINYGTIMKVFNNLRQASIKNVTLVTEE